MLHSISTEALVATLKKSKTIAVVGASPNPARPSNWISRFLMDAGYRVIPVNPGHDKLFGLPCFPDVVSIPEAVDIVNIFRRSDRVIPIIDSVLKRDDVKLVWMQDGVYNETVREPLAAQDIPLVMDDCIYRFLNRFR